MRPALLGGGGPPRTLQQLRDALDVAAIQWAKLDRDYLSHWARELGLEATLKDILANAKILQGGEGLL